MCNKLRLLLGILIVVALIGCGGKTNKSADVNLVKSNACTTAPKSFLIEDIDISTILGYAGMNNSAMSNKTIDLCLDVVSSTSEDVQGTFGLGIDLSGVSSLLTMVPQLQGIDIGDSFKLLELVTDPVDLEYTDGVAETDLKYNMDFDISPELGSDIWALFEKFKGLMGDDYDLTSTEEAAVESLLSGFVTILRDKITCTASYPCSALSSEVILDCNIPALKIDDFMSLSGPLITLLTNMDSDRSVSLSKVAIVTRDDFFDSDNDNENDNSGIDPSDITDLMGRELTPEFNFEIKLTARDETCGIMFYFDQVMDMAVDFETMKLHPGKTWYQISEDWDNRSCGEDIPDLLKNNLIVDVDDDGSAYSIYADTEPQVLVMKDILINPMGDDRKFDYSIKGSDLECYVHTSSNLDDEDVLEIGCMPSGGEHQCTKYYDLEE